MTATDQNKMSEQEEEKDSRKKISIGDELIWPGDLISFRKVEEDCNSVYLDREWLPTIWPVRSPREPRTKFRYLDEHEPCQGQYSAVLWC